MNSPLLTCIFTLFYFGTHAQSFYVTPTEKGFENKIIDKMRYDGYKVVSSKEESDYTIDCLVDGQYNALKFGNMFHGYVRFSNTKTGEEVTRTKEVGRSPSIYNAMQAGPAIMARIAKKYLKPCLDLVAKDHNK